MKNQLVHLMLNDEVRIIAADTTQLVEEAKAIHGTYPVATAVLGRTLTAAAILGSQLRQEWENLTITLNGGGPAGTVLATANGNCEVKGYIANPQVNLPAREDGKLDVGGAVGNDGFLTVSKDLGLKEPYVGQTALVSGEIAEDLAYYYLQSEQQPTIVYLSVWVDFDTSVLRAGGLVISPMPGASEETLSFIESRLFEIQNYALMLMQYSPEEAVRKIFRDGKIELTRTQEPKYVCNCTRERFSQGILSLGRKEIEQMLKEDGQAEVICQFCNKQYLFRAEDLQKLLEETSE